MPFVKIWIHAVWSTKNRIPYLNKDIRQDVFTHIHQNALKKGILMDIVKVIQIMFIVYLDSEMIKQLAKYSN